MPHPLSRRRWISSVNAGLTTANMNTIRVWKFDTPFPPHSLAAAVARRYFLPPLLIEICRPYVEPASFALQNLSEREIVEESAYFCCLA